MLDASLLSPRRYRVAGHVYATKLLADIHAIRVGCEVEVVDAAACLQAIPVVLDRCSRCGRQAHASETDDNGVCAACSLPVVQPAALLAYWICTSGQLDIRVVYRDLLGREQCDLGECIDGGWKWHYATVLPADVEEAAGNALLNWPHAMPGYAGTESGAAARDNADAFYDRDIGPDPILGAEAR